MKANTRQAVLLQKAQIIDAHVDPRAEQWAERIGTQLGKSVEAIIDVGRLLLQAKADLPHGEWGRLFEDGLVPFSQQTARKLMAVAAHPSLPNRAHERDLPPSWTTLYELTKVEPKRLTEAFKDGAITPDMKRRDVLALRDTRQKATEEPAPSLSLRDDDNVMAIRNALRPVRTLIQSWPDGRSLDSVIHEVRQLLNFLERVEAQPV